MRDGRSCCKVKAEQADPSCCLSYFAFQSAKRPPKTIGTFQSYSQFIIRGFIYLSFKMFFSLKAGVVS
jgi:hypothetical protein